MSQLATFKRFSINVGPLVHKSVKFGSPTKYTYPMLFQASSITSKRFLDRSIQKPAPWPYKEKKFTWYHSLFNLDNTLSRFDENTQVIVVEGNIGAGKTELAKKLADELDMLYFPEKNAEETYIDEQGFDLRELDDIMPPSFKSCVLKDFYDNPHGENVGSFQMKMFILRLEQYMEALAHLLNTGQGVVLERCVFSDFVFVEAMVKMGYLSSGVKTWYNEARTNALHDIDLKPTVVIYLDVDVNTALERIKKRNIDYEVKSKVLTKEYLGSLEHYYKHEYLKYISIHSEILVYDWNRFGDHEAVVHDIEKIKFEKYDKYDKKLKEWRNEDADDWDMHRMFYSNERLLTLMDFQIPRYTCPELFAPPEDVKKLDEILDKRSSMIFEKEFNPYHGDKVLFRLKDRNYWDRQKYRLYS